jgi:hypothetical protein
VAGARLLPPVRHRFDARNDRPEVVLGVISYAIEWADPREISVRARKKTT